MQKRLTATVVLTLMITVAIAAVATADGEKPIVVRSGNLILTLNGGASPKALPKSRLAPVSVNASGRIATADGTHLPVAKEFVLDIGKTGVIEAKKFPTCRAGEIEATTTQQAESKCKSAIVGGGESEVEVQFPESSAFTAKGPLVVFNGGEKGGRSLMLIHAYVSVPTPTAIVSRVITTKEHKGSYRLHSVAPIPAIAGGAGSLKSFSIKLDRQGYLLANCSNGHFSAHVMAKFADGEVVSGSFLRPCTGIG